MCVKRDVFGSDGFLSAGATVAWAADNHPWWMYIRVCLLVYFLTVGSAVLGGRTAHTYIWVKYCMCVREHRIGQEREDINVYACECSEFVHKS